MALNLDIRPYRGVGPLTLGATIQEVRDALGRVPVPFLKAPSDQYPTDAFNNIGVLAYYRAPGVAEAFEFGPPSAPTFRGRALLGELFFDVASIFRSWDASVSVDDSGLTSLLFGIGIYAPAHLKTPHARVEGVIVFDRAYYE
jgi:hypothetical protein